MARTKPLPGFIRKLNASETSLYCEHLLRLDSESRRARFAHFASDGFISAYARKAGEPGTIIFGYFDDGRLRAVAELKRIGNIWGRPAEAAFSVERPYLNLGIASELMERVIRSARNRGVRHLVLSFLAENSKMRRIAAKYGANLTQENGAVIADLATSRADYLSFASEAIDDRLGLFLSLIDRPRLAM